MLDIPIEYSEIFTRIMYFAPVLILLIVFWCINKKRIWIAIPITIITDLITFWNVLTYYESWQLALVFLIPQIIVVAIIALAVMFISKRKRA